jgi:DNA topoisomerase IA
MFIDEVVQDAFGDLVEPSYTAQLEATLDEIAAGTRDWRSALSAWQATFSRYLDGAAEFLAQMATIRSTIVASE